MARWLVLGLSVVTFLTAAKAHGRQLRLERELAGYWHVTFGGRNPTWVEELWRRERLYFFSALALLVITTIAVRMLGTRQQWPLSFGLVPHLLVPAIGAFVGTGLYSAARTGTLTGAGWWLLTLGLGGGLLWLVRRMEHGLVK